MSFAPKPTRSRRSFLKAGLVAVAATASTLPSALPDVGPRPTPSPSLPRHPFLRNRGTPGSGPGRTPRLLLISLRGGNDALQSIIPVGDPAFDSTLRPTLHLPRDPATDYSRPGSADFPESGPNQPTFHYRACLRSGNGFAALHPSLKFAVPVHNAGDLVAVHRAGTPHAFNTHFQAQRSIEDWVPPLISELARKGSETIPPSAAHDTAHESPAPEHRDLIATDGDTDPYFLFPTSDATNGGAPFHEGDPGRFVVPRVSYPFFRRLHHAISALNRTPAVFAQVDLHGFDTHVAQGTLDGPHADLMKTLAWSFYAVRSYFLGHADRARWEDVVVLAISEFGRSVRENDDRGTEHGNAGIIWIAGGAVAGLGHQGRTSGLRNIALSAAAADDVPWIPGRGGSLFGSSRGHLQPATDALDLIRSVTQWVRV